MFKPKSIKKHYFRVILGWRELCGNTKHVWMHKASKLILILLVDILMHLLWRWISKTRAGAISCNRCPDIFMVRQVSGFQMIVYIILFLLLSVRDRNCSLYGIYGISPLAPKRIESNRTYILTVLSSVTYCIFLGFSCSFIPFCYMVKRGTVISSKISFSPRHGFR